MSRPERIQWGELRKYMNKLSLKQPTAHFFLKNTKLYIDNRSDSPSASLSMHTYSFSFLNFTSYFRLYVWNLEEGQVQENNVIMLPSTNSIQLPKMNIKQRLKY